MVAVVLAAAVGKMKRGECVGMKRCDLFAWRLIVCWLVCGDDTANEVSPVRGTPSNGHRLRTVLINSAGLAASQPH